MDKWAQQTCIQWALHYAPELEPDPHMLITLDHSLDGPTLFLLDLTQCDEKTKGQRLLIFFVSMSAIPFNRFSHLPI